MDDSFLQALKNKRVLVTGATGFTGAQLTARLVAAGADVRAIARVGVDLARGPWVSKVRWVLGDVADPATVAAAADGVQFIFNLASGLRQADASEERQREIHVVGTQLLARAALANPAFERFIHVSTIGVHGHVEHPPADEESPVAPSDSYQRTKAEGEAWLRDFATAQKLPFTIIRPCGIYGPGDTRLLKIFRLASWPLLPLPGRMKCHYHLVHVDDLVDALVTAATHPAAQGQTFICGNPESLPLERFVRIVADELHSRCRVVRIPVAPLRLVAWACETVCGWLRIKPLLYRRRVAFFTKNRTFDTIKIRTQLGFEPRYTNEVGIARTARWYADNGWLTPAGQSRHARWRAWWPVVAASGLGLLGLLVLHTRGKLLLPAWFLAPVVLLPIALLVERGWRERTPLRPSRRSKSAAALAVLAGFLLLSLFSSAASHPWFFFQNWPPPGGAAGLSGTWKLGGFVILTACLTPFLLSRLRYPARLTGFILVASQVCCLAGLLSFTGGAALYRDDHPSMMFRLWEISRTWPQLLNYVPYWNGGVVHYAGTASGLNGLGLLFWPALRTLPVEAVYTPMVGITFVLLVPALAILSLRIMGSSWNAAWCAGILALGVSRYNYLWMWHFGTVGACFASVFILPFSASLFRVVWRQRRERWLFVVLVVSFLMLTMWPPGALMAAAAVLAAVASVRRWTWRAFGFMALAGLLSLALWYRTLGLLYFQGGEEYFGFLLGRASGGAAVAAGSAVESHLLREGWDAFVAQLHELNPLLVFLGVLGVWVLPLRSVRRWFAPLLLLLAALSGWGGRAFPHLELVRMAIPLAFVAIVPTALILDRILRGGHYRMALLRAALVALLVLTGWMAATLYRNRVHPPTTVLAQKTEALAKLVRTHTQPGERVLFAGRTVHFYGDHGHVALLPHLAGREMMACDYYAFSPRLVEYQYPPRGFRDTPEQASAFFDLYNVGLVLTYHANWAAFFRATSDRFEEVPATDEVFAFRVRRTQPGSLALMGHASVQADFNRLRVTTDAPDQDSVIKYNWCDGMVATPPATVRPYEIGEGIRLIWIDWNGASDCTIRFGSRW